MTRTQDTPFAAARRRLVSALPIPLLACLVAGCHTVIAPPAVVSDPATIYVLDAGRTTSLVLPAAEGGGFVRYAYGNWDWYALERTGPIRGLLALFWPSQGTLARRALRPPIAGEPGARAIARQVDPMQHVHALRVEQAKAGALRDRLESLYRANIATAVEGRLSDFTFVRHPRRYSGWGNSNHQIADWLRAAGCDVRGMAFFADWRVERRERPKVQRHGTSDTFGGEFKRLRRRHPFRSHRASRVRP